MIYCKHCPRYYRRRSWYHKHLKSKHPNTVEASALSLFRAGLKAEFQKLYRKHEL